MSKQWPSGGQRALRINISYWKIYNSINSPFELQIDFKNDCNGIYSFFAKFKICRHIRLCGRHSKNLNNLHKNNVFSKRYIIRNKIVMENYKWCFKKQFLSLVKHKYRPHAWQDTRFEIWAFNLAIMTSRSLLLELGHGDWDFSSHGLFMSLSLAQPSNGEWSITIIASTNQSFCYNNFEIQLMLCHHQVSCKQYHCLHAWHR